MTDIEGFLTIYGHSDNLLNNLLIVIDKSQLVLSTWVRFLGFLCDSVRQAFNVPEDKKAKFAALREDILSSPFVGLKTHQHFSGKVMSFSLAIPGCKLYVRDVLR